MGKKCFIFEIQLGVTGVEKYTYFTFKLKECNFSLLIYFLLLSGP